MGNTSCCCSCSTFQQENENLISSMSLLFDDMTQIDALISYIDQLLNAIGEGRNVDKPDRDRDRDGVDSSIKSGGDLLEKVLKRASRHTCNCRKVSMPTLDRETRKLVIDISKEGAQIKWLGVTLSVVAFVLDRFDQISSNIKQCEELLKDLCKLAKNIKRLDRHLPEEEMNEALQLIVEGSLMCVSQMRSDGISRFFAAPVDAEDLQSFRSKLGHKYSELTLDATTTLLERIPADMSNVLERIPAVVPPSQGEPSQAVGIEGGKHQVIKLLDMENKSRRLVVIYGQGGIGKTTLGSAVFNSLDLNYKHCRVDMEQNCSEGDLKLLQQKMLRDLFNINVVLSSWGEGQQALSRAFKELSKASEEVSRPVFIFVDNALKGTDLENLLPIKELALLPAQCKILLTTRNLNETQIIRQAEIDVFSYQVHSLPQSEAATLLSEYALGSRDKNFHHTINIEGLLQICGGIPLVLRMAGCKLREYADSVAACKDAVEYIIEELQEGGDAELSERMVDFVYNRLQQSSKDAFQDIVFFFYDENRDKVAYIYGEMQLSELERAALVNVTEKGRLNVHDIVKARGKMLSEGHRITDEQSLTDVLRDEEKIQNTKGIYLSDTSQYLWDVHAKHLNSMSRSLRVLWLGGMKIVNGECKGTFENLRFLHLDYRNYSQMDLNKLPKLAVFHVHVFIAGKFFEFSGGVSSLKEITLEHAELENVTTTLCQHKSLRALRLLSCEGFSSIPETFGNLSALEVLLISSCGNLVSLPESFGSLLALKRLYILDCHSLSCLPQNFGQLKSLEYMSMGGCKSLESLSSDFGCLSSLIAIHVSSCSQLEEKAMDILAEMKTLLFADIRRSPKLIKRWKQVKHQYSLAVLINDVRHAPKNFSMNRALWDARHRAFFHSESRLQHVDDDGKLGESSTSSSFAEGARVALLFSMSELTSPANGRSLETLKEKCVELGSKGFHIIYVDMQEGLW